MNKWQLDTQTGNIDKKGKDKLHRQYKEELRTIFTGEDAAVQVIEMTRQICAWPKKDGRYQFIKKCYVSILVISS